jgi:aryl carrier-like protein
VISLAWNRWRESGQAVAAAGGQLAADQGITDAEGGEVLLRVLDGNPAPHVLISEFKLDDVLRPERTQTDAAVKEESEGPSDAAQPGLTTSRPQLATEFVAPSTDAERALASVWEELMGIRPIGVHDNFFELGGHSLLAMRVLNRLSQVHSGAKLSLRAIFDTPTIAGLAARIGATSAAVTAPDNAKQATAKREHEDRYRDIDLDTLDKQAIDSLSDEEVEAMLKRLSSEESK